jgi:hypothetical protein
MDLEHKLRSLEERFWRAGGDPVDYAKGISREVLHVLPGLGIADRAAVLEGVRATAAWSSFTIDDAHVLDLADDAAALVCTTRARRGAKRAYAAAITSVYRRERGSWRLVLHQQTPL